MFNDIVTILTVWLVCMALLIGFAPKAESATVVLVHDTIIIDGTILASDVSRVQALVDGHPEVKTVALHSQGGVAIAGLGIAYLIHYRHLDTEAYGDCVSACAMIWLAGKHRMVRGTAKVLQHGIYHEDGSNLNPEELAMWNVILTNLYMRIAPEYSKLLVDQLNNPIDQFIQLN